MHLALIGIHACQCFFRMDGLVCFMQSVLSEVIVVVKEHDNNYKFLESFFQGHNKNLSG